MLIKQIYTGCLSESAYYIESGGEAAVIDPLRDIDEYLQLARENRATIKYIFETHFHADFVSGHLDLQQATGAPIVYGPRTITKFPIHLATDGEIFKLGALTIEVLHTPGHTVESTCYLLRDEHGAPHALFSGDTLFVDDVGRPDLSSGDLGKEELASILFDSIQQKILPLPDNVLLYPAHGPGSSCGKNIGIQTVSTIGEQRKTNYALLIGDRLAFVETVTKELSAPPQYFPVNAKINQEGYESLGKILEQGLQPVSPAEVERRMVQDNIILLDSRSSTVFTTGFVPGSVSVGLEGRFAEWAGIVLPFDKPLLLVTEPGQEKETLIRLARVGFSRIEGYLEGGFEAWRSTGRKIDMVIDVEADELAMDMPHDERLVLLDVRRETEHGNGHVENAVNIPLETLTDPAAMADLDDNYNIYLHCRSGYRSVIAASLLKRQGIHNVRNVLGGWEKIKDQPGFTVARDTRVLN